MPSKALAPVADQPGIMIQKPIQPRSAAARRSAAAKRAGTMQRRRDERRAECLAQIEAQIADGSLVIRQMTIAERKAVTGTTRGRRHGRLPVWL